LIDPLVYFYKAGVGALEAVGVSTKFAYFVGSLNQSWWKNK
jgi:hypothetical protein